MPPFRCYFLDRNGHIISAQVLNATSEADAITLADAVAAEHNGDAIEVWAGATLILRRERQHSESDVTRR